MQVARARYIIIVTKYLGGISVGWLNGGKYGIEYDGDPDGFIGMGL